MLLFAVLCLVQSGARHRHHRSHSGRRHDSTNAISEMDIKVPFTKSWYYGRNKKPKSNQLSRGIARVLKALEDRRTRDAMLTDLLFTEATKAGAIVDKMVNSYLGNRRKFRDDEVYLQEQMDDTLLYALSVLAQREKQQIDYAKRQQERQREFERQEELAKKEQRRKQEQADKEMQYRMKQMEYEQQRQLALDKQVGQRTVIPQSKGILGSLFG